MTDAEPGGARPEPATPAAREPSAAPAATANAKLAHPPTTDPKPNAAPPVSTDGATSELLDLIDRLAVLLQRSDLTEIAIESGGTGVVLRKAVASAAPAGQAGSTSGADAAHGSGAANAAHGSGAANPTNGSLGEPSAAGREPAPPSVPSIKAPLTGLFYASPAPGTAPYVQVGGEVAVGQVIGLIEAMKLFNEIKSDLAGRVIRVVAESGALVKAKQPLIEVEPL